MAPSARGGRPTSPPAGLSSMARMGQLAVLAAACLSAPALAFCWIDDDGTRALVAASAAVAAAGCVGTAWLVPHVGEKTRARGICGKDLNKKGSPLGEVPVPESAGLAVGCVFLLCVTVFEVLHYFDASSLLAWVASGFTGPPPVLGGAIDEAWLVDYNAALATIGFMMFLGFADDVLDLRWRVKLVLPLFASLPLLAAYSGGTGVAVPKPLQALIGLPGYVELGPLYFGYMVALVIFCTNSINILAGVNGLEAGQTFVIACAMLTHSLSSIAWGVGAGSDAARDAHLFSAYLTLPLAGCTLGLLVHNWYPSRVFVGDTFTYFAGMTIAVAGILGHFSETLLLFLVPQIVNFVYSIPQLLKIVPCPRHRLPVFDPATGLLRPKDQPDMNVVNLVLRVFGNTTENALCVRILAIQALCCAAGCVAHWVLQGVWK